MTRETAANTWGLVEVGGLAGAAAAAEAMKKARGTTDLAVKSLGNRMTLLVQGDPALVAEAVRAGAAEAQRLGALVSSAVMEKLDPGIADLLFQA